MGPHRSPQSPQTSPRNTPRREEPKNGVPKRGPAAACAHAPKEPPQGEARLSLMYPSLWLIPQPPRARYLVCGSREFCRIQHEHAATGGAPCLTFPALFWSSNAGSPTRPRARHDWRRRDGRMASAARPVATITPGNATPRRGPMNAPNAIGRLRSRRGR